MKIIVTTGIYPPDIGGPATYSKLLFDELPKRGIDISVLSFGEVRKLPKIIRHFYFIAKLLKRARGADLIFAQDTVSVGLPSLWVSRILGKRFFVRVPGDYAWEQSVQRYGVTESIDDFQHKTYGRKVEILRKVQKRVVNGADKVITPSMYFKNLVSKWVKNPEKVNCIYNGIDLSAIPGPSLSDSQSMLSYEPKTIISAGRLLPWKGFATLIAAMKSLPEWKLFIAGDGPLRGELEKVARENGVSERVFFLGQIARTDLIKKMQNCDVFVLNTHFESFSFQVVEAMACGIPVITTNIGNLAEIVDHGQNGILIAPDDKEALISAVVKLSSDKTLRHSIIASAKKKAMQFSIQNTIDRLLSLVNGTLVI